MTSVLTHVQEKDEELQSLVTALDGVLDQFSGSKTEHTQSLPEFEAYGWRQLATYVRRLEDAVNEPQLEAARKVLEGIGITLVNLEALKAELRMRRVETIALLKKVAASLGRIADSRIRVAARDDLKSYLEQANYSILVSRTEEWNVFAERSASLSRKADGKSSMYDTVFKRALSDAPSLQTIEKLVALESRVSEVGGTPMLETLRSEGVKDTINPIQEIDDKIGVIAKRKEEIRETRGKSPEIERIATDGKSLDQIISELTEAAKAASGDLEQVARTDRKLLNRYNAIASILGESTIEFPGKSNLSELVAFEAELRAKIDKANEKLAASLSPDASDIVKSLAERTLPDEWDSERIANAIRELLRKGASFQVRMS